MICQDIVVSVHVMTVTFVVMVVVRVLVIDAVMARVLAGKLAVVLRILLDVLGVSVQNAHEVEADHENEEEVDTDEDPERVVDEVLAALPVYSGLVDGLASASGGIFNLAREEAEPDEVNEEKDK